MNKIFPILVLLITLGACAPDGDTDLVDSLTDTIETLSPIAFYRPADENNPLDVSTFPFPNNFSSLPDVDGTLNIPLDPGEDPSFSNPKVALNSIDGFSNTAPMVTRLSSSVDTATLLANIFVYELNNPLVSGAGINPTGGFGTELTLTTNPLDPAGEILVVAQGNSNGTTELILAPMRPLASDTAYVVVLRNGLTTSTGTPYTRDFIYTMLNSATPLIDGSNNSVTALPDDTANQLELLRPAVLSNQTVIAASIAGIASTDEIISHWVFKTQTIGFVMAQRYTDIQSENPVLTIPAAGNPIMADAPGGTAAEVHYGTLTLDYFLADTTASDFAPLQGYWKDAGDKFLTLGSNVPVGASKTIPVLISVPKTAHGGNGWPTIIFQHGITANRTGLLALANTFGQLGYAVVAIDLPLHGIDSADPTFGALAIAGLERHFDLDIMNNTTRAIGVGDGVFDGSGAHFINLANLLVSRDNVRQSINDLFTLRRALEIFGGSGGIDFDPNQLYYIGHSLGGIVGGTFLAYDTNVKHSVLGMAGGGIMKILDGSQTFGPVIAAGLSANGVDKGTADYESFMIAAQTMIDTIDPINFITNTKAGRGLLLYEIIGGGGNPADLVVPNSVPDVANGDTTTVGSPLAGTDPYGFLMLGLAGRVTNAQVTAGQITAASNLQAWIRFTEGDHASLLSPAASANVTTEIFTEMGTFFASDATVVPLDNSNTILDFIP